MHPKRVSTCGTVENLVGVRRERQLGGGEEGKEAKRRNRGSRGGVPGVRDQMLRF
jgi:hypothetical protein